jgi:L-threonylcarbamoyladenylate synthase
MIESIKLDQNLARIVSQAVSVLEAGGLVIFPTETVYGAGVDATNPKAVQKLLSFKSRREGKPLSIAVSNQKMALEFAELNQSAKKIYSRFLPGPITVVSKVKADCNLAPGVASEFETVGVRIPAHDLTLKILQKIGKPITATSANASGAKRPYSIADMLAGLSGKQKKLIDLIIDAGTLPPNQPSTVIDTTLSAPLTMRAGDISELNFSDSKTTFSIAAQNELETQGLAGRLMLKHWNQVRSQGLVIGLVGPLGAGKTTFTKGVAEFLGITEVITSPTYSYIQEYDFKKHQVEGKFHHLDVWKVDSPELASRLQINSLIKPNNVVVIEWIDQLETSIIKPNLLISLEPINNNAQRKIKVVEIE